MKIEMPSDISQLLGGYSADRFLAGYWQKKPLLIRNAMPGFAPPVAKAGLFALAAQDDVECRLVERTTAGWSLAHGPFGLRKLRAARGHPWTLLVQGVNLHHAGADRLLRRFDFIPAARLDDLMISWASDGGGVGPHVDSYDVFLLQAAGRRRWRLSMQKDKALVANAPLKILRAFKASDEYVLEPGDMLYLPPGCAHEGVALGECMTYSIGFRAPSAQELARGLLEQLADDVVRDGMFADPGLRAPRENARLDDAYVTQAARLIGRIETTRSRIARFLGRYLTEPKSQVFFEPPRRALAKPRFCALVARHGIELDPKTRMLHRNDRVYINGEEVLMPPDAAALTRLADARILAPTVKPGAAALDLLYSWYTHGWLHPGSK